jgi:hypothetical protein
MQNAMDILVLTIWFFCIAVGIGRSRGRGWTCIIGAALGGLVGPCISFAVAAWMPPFGHLSLDAGIALIGASLTMALILGTYVRAVVEGVHITMSAHVAPAMVIRYGRSM